MAQTGSTQSVLIFVSDTQSPLPFERLYPNYSDNERATQMILADILDEKNVEAVIHAGDITGYGSSRKQWLPVLPFLDTLHSRRIPFVSAKGNHDYYFLPSEAMKFFKKYVPESSSDYSMHQFGPVAIVILNSNFDRLKKSEIAAEESWYSYALKTCESDTAIRFVISVDHHPPHTNSAAVSGSNDVRKYFLPAFFSSRKSVLFVSGHAHRFEHFQLNGKDFLVIGGGGGVFQDERSKPVEKDLYTGSDQGKFFHYVRCITSSDSLIFQVIRVIPKSGLTESAYTFTLRNQEGSN